MPSITIQALREATRDGISYETSIAGQVEAINRKETSAGKPFYELILRDATDTLTLRAWSDKPAFTACQKLTQGSFVEIYGNFSQGSFGLDASGWSIEPLSEENITLLLDGSKEQQATNEAAYQLILSAVASITDPRLKLLCDTFLTQYAARFRRSA